MPFLSNIARMAYEANLGIMLLSILMSFIEPFLNIYGYLPANVAKQLMNLNLLSYINGLLPSALASVGGIIIGAGGLTAGAFTLLKLTTLSASLNINSNIAQVVEILVLYSIAQFVFGGFPWFAVLVNSIISSANPQVPGLSLILAQLSPGIISAIDLLSAMFTILSYVYILEIFGVTL